MHRSPLVVAVIAAALTLAPLLAGPAARADLGPHAATLNGVTFPTGTNGCTGPLVGVYGASAAKAFILQAAKDYCATFADPGSAPDVEYAAGGASCPGDSYAAGGSDGNEVGVSTVFANSCTNDGQAVDPSALTDTPLAVNAVEAIATCPGATVPNGGAVHPAGTTPCGAFSTDPGASGAVSCAPAGLSLPQAQLLYNQQIGNERSVGGCNHANAVQQRVPGSGDRITWCFNVYGSGTDQCQNEGAAGALAPTTTVMVQDVCGPTAADGNYAQGYVSRALVVADPRSTSSPQTALQGCGIVNVGGASGYNGACDPVTSARQCPGDADVASGRYPIWGYLHLVTNATTANNAAARGFVNFVTPVALGGQDQEEALLEQSGFVPTCEMQFARADDAAPYVVASPTCDPPPYVKYDCSSHHCFGVNYWKGAITGAATDIKVVQASPGQDLASGPNNPPTPNQLGFVNSEMWLVQAYPGPGAPNACSFGGQASDCWIEAGIHVGYFANDVRTGGQSVGCTTACYWYANEAPGTNNYHDYFLGTVPPPDFGGIAGVAIQPNGSTLPNGQWSVFVGGPNDDAWFGYPTNSMSPYNATGSFQIGGEIDGSTLAHAPPVTYTDTRYRDQYGNFQYEGGSKADGGYGGFYGSPGGLAMNSGYDAPWEWGWASRPSADHHGGVWTTQCDTSNAYQCYGTKTSTGALAPRVAATRATIVAPTAAPMPAVGVTATAGITSSIAMTHGLEGVPALTPTLDAATALTATYALDDALRFAQAHPFATTDGVTPTVTRVAVLPASAVSAALNGVAVGNDPTRLVCYVRVEGALDMSHESYPALSGPLQPAHIGDMVFDARTGNLLMAGFDG